MPHTIRRSIDGLGSDSVPHFIAEFRQFAGTTPVRFAKGDSRLSRMFTGGEVDAVELGD